MGIFSKSVLCKVPPASAVSPLCLAIAAAMFVLPAEAATRITDDYIAIDVEGEDIDSADERWVLTEPNTPQTTDDPDPNHSADASGNAYLELLPDIRVTHDDPFGPPTAFWGNGGQGPDLNFTVDFPEAGRYHVHVRALSTGSEDNGIHVGLNGDFQPQGLRMQWCSNKEGWTWSSAQRGGESMPCGTEKTIWLDVPEPGVHTVNFSAREDGFEFDRFMLIKDLSDNTMICQPSGVNAVDCAAGSLPEADEIVDVTVELVADRTAGLVDDVFTFTAKVANHDSEDIAENTTLTLDLGTDIPWSVGDMTGGCFGVGATIECELGGVQPVRMTGYREVVVTATATASGESSVSASVATSSVENDAENNETVVDIEVAEAILYALINSSLDAPDAPVQEQEEFLLVVDLENSSEHPAHELEVMLEIPDSLRIVDFPESCTAGTPLQCNTEELASGDSQRLVFMAASDRSGLYPLRARVAYQNSEDPAVVHLDFLSVVTVDQTADVDSAVNGDTDGASGDGESDSIARGGMNLLLLFLMSIGVRQRYVTSPR